MSEFDFIDSIIDREFFCDKPVMEETSPAKGKSNQIIELKYNSTQINRINLYRFDLNKNNFLIFFNKTHDAPKGLKQFCDYIIMIELDGRLKFLLVELKRGDSNGYNQQLDGGRLERDNKGTFLCYCHKSFHVRQFL